MRKLPQPPKRKGVNAIGSLKSSMTNAAMPLVFKKGVGYDSAAIFETMKGRARLY
jgi:hypothetical protein